MSSAERAAVDTIREIPVRLSVELGRSFMPLSRAVSLPPGSVVELDRGAEDAVDLFVNGRLFATGVLVVAEGGEWAVRIERLHTAGARQTEGPRRAAGDG
jgi:flagellar motor switch protein FliN/FliY